MPRSAQRLSTSILLLTALALPGAWTAAARAVEAVKPAPVSAEVRQQVQKLSRTALDKDPAAALSAVRELSALGEAAKPALRDATRTLLGRDRSTIERSASALGDVNRLGPFVKEMDELRKSALANIAKLEHDETLKIAHENYKKLTAMLATSNAANELRAPVLEAIGRRAELLKAYRDAAPAADANFKEADEAKLAALAEKVLGMSVSQAQEVPAFGGKNEPSDPAQRGLWFYRACRQIEKYNAALDGLMNADEIANVKMVNGYREALGILPYEVDARLIQSARRHSKEMVDLNYFSHVSPTPSEADFAMRLANAGYAQARGENIAYGTPGGEAVFWMWFDSPGHHKNMAAPGNTALGVGRWGNHWTQNMGGGPRLMLQSADDRKAAVVKGTVLPPDGGGTGSGKTKK